MVNDNAVDADVQSFNFLKYLWPFTDALHDAKVLCVEAKWKKEEADVITSKMPWREF